MEQRFDYDFSSVRVHNDTQSAQSAAALNARAYTLGSHIVFGAGEYAPRSRSGRSLIAHELAHVVQQGAARAAIPRKPSVGSPTDSAEQAADVAARAATAEGAVPQRSTALELRQLLRASSLAEPTIQRAVKTWGGEYDTDKYELTKDPGMDGVEIELRFKPGKNVNAELFGMTQTARSLKKGSPVPTSGFGKDAAKALKSRTIPAGKAGAGTRIDRLSTKGNPLYGSENPSKGSKLADTPPLTGKNQHGWRYTDKKGKLKKQDARLYDRPQLPSSYKESSQTFETTVLAVKGGQAGTYYGSVQWGWEKDAAGTVSKLPLKVVSKGAPSATFGTASELWNKGKTSKGKETMDLPIMDVQVISQDDVSLFSNPIDALADLVPGTPLPRGTRIRVLDASDPMVQQIEIVDGPLTGRRGYIVALSNYRAER